MLVGRWTKELMTREHKRRPGYGEGVNGIGLRILWELVD